MKKRGEERKAGRYEKRKERKINLGKQKMIEKRQLNR
jgi:hypothetical protein